MITGDNEYSKKEFIEFVDSIDATFDPVAAYDHQSNRTIESANRTLRSYYRRIRAADRNSSTADVVAEATIGKNIGKGGKLASSYELVFNLNPRIMNDVIIPELEIVTIEKNSVHKVQQRLNQMLRSNVRATPAVYIGDVVYFWRDKARWAGQATVVDLNGHMVKVMHTGIKKTTAYSLPCS